ncbi:MAG: radical SAM protein [Planctomycetes bacterium]|nr:radical SAM protein [Planctomycetota bacterium]
MKPSRYNRLFQASDGTWLAFNSWSTALAEIEPAQKPFVEGLLAAPNSTPCDTAEKRDIREALLRAHFLIEDDEDELATAKADLERDRHRVDHLFLTIAPTLDCNFRCDYCFEEHLKVHMSKRVQDALLAWCDAKSKPCEGLVVTWYGGEPLLPTAYPVVERLSAGFQALCERRGMRYDATLVTNGFFLDREKMTRLKELGVARVQVTLDGPPDEHDKRRHLIGGRGTFWRIVENLKACVDLAEFQLRINVDARNALRALEVLEILKEHGLQRVRPYLAQVTHDGAACGNIQELCYSSDGFAKLEVELYREAAKRNLGLSRYPFRLAGAFCTADRANGWVVAPNGLLFKCWHEVTMNPEKSVGSLLDGQQDWQRSNENKWLAWDPLAKSGCRSCDVMPLCHGGCPLEAMRHPERDRGACEHYKFHLEPLLEIRHRHPGPDATTGPARDVACK